MLRLASLLWRLRRATMETGLFEIEASDLSGRVPTGRVDPASREIVYAVFRRKDAPSIDRDPTPGSVSAAANALAKSDPDGAASSVSPATDLAHCFLRLADLPSFALDRLSRYEVMLWRQVDQILLALDGLDRRKPQERGSRWSLVTGNSSARERAKSLWGFDRKPGKLGLFCRKQFHKTIASIAAICRNGIELASSAAR